MLAYFHLRNTLTYLLTYLLTYPGPVGFALCFMYVLRMLLFLIKISLI